MNPPPAEGIAARLFAGPALRTQPDRRLVTLVREGYETAFEEIVRRYGKPLGRYAAAIVGSRSEDVTQDAFSKALLALRRSEDAEIELRPWLYRIVRNTALNDLRDRPPAEAELAEAIRGGSSASEEFERREELAELIRGLRALPEPQRAAIVMRELEGLSHEEIAAALGISGGGARQAIYRARQALRDGAGLAIPLPLLRMLIDHGAEAGIAGAGGAAVAAGTAGAGGAGSALKIGLATVLVAGTVGTGVALDDHHHSARDSSGADTVEATSLATGAGAPEPVADAVGLGSEVSAGNDGSKGEGGSNRQGRGSGSGHREQKEGDDRGGLGSSGPAPGSGGRGGGSEPEGGQRHGGGGGERHDGGGTPLPSRESHSGPGGRESGGPDGTESSGGGGSSNGSSSDPESGVSGSGSSGSGSSGGSDSSDGSGGGSGSFSGTEIDPYP